jgi:hypothetical protein
MRDALFQSSTDPNTGKPPVVEPETPPATPPAKPAEPTTPPAAPPDPKTPETTPATPEGKKASPWKLMDQYKDRALKAEAQVVELSKHSTPEAQQRLKDDAVRLERAESRVKELEDEMRFIDYSKSAEFQEKHQKPYESAWQRAMKDLKQIVVELEGGGARQFTSEDMLQLVNLDLPSAKGLAKVMAPEFVDDLMQHRNKIRELFDQQASALDDAKKNGGERAKQRETEFTRQREQMQSFIGETWKTANETFHKDPDFGKYFTPVENDADGNKRLEDGFKLADSAFSESPLNPNLSPEQRAAIVRRHAAVRNRCAAFGRLCHQNAKQATEIAELKKKLEGYAGSTPPDGGGRSTPAPANGARTTKEQRQAEMQEAMLKVARRI